MTKRKTILVPRLIALLATGALLAHPVLAQTVDDQVVPEAGLNIPANAQLFGDPNSNVYRPTATVNGEIITATDVDQRLALIRIASGGEVPPEQLQQLRVQVFGQLVDEMLQIQEAHANEIDVPDADINAEFARVAATLRQSPEQFTQFLVANGSSASSMRQQLRGNLAWQRLLARNVDPYTNVSQEEVQAMLERLQSQRGLEEYRIGEIYLRTTPETIAAVAENARRIMQSLGERSVTFQDAAGRFSEASSAASGGDLGWLRLTQLPASMAEAAQAMEPGQMAGPVESPGGMSILLMIDKRRVLTADPRDAILSLKQVSLTFAAGTTSARANELAGNFQARTRAIAGCGSADQIAAQLGAEVISRDQIAMRDLPPPLQAPLGTMQIGQVTQMFGSPEQGVSVLVLCGREMPAEATTPTVEAVADRIQQERVQRRAQRYLRDIRRDAVIDYS
ncbi:MAG: peptidylprolyl isomerase [Sphingopyxis sp.]